MRMPRRSWNCILLVLIYLMGFSLLVFQKSFENSKTVEKPQDNQQIQNPKSQIQDLKSQNLESQSTNCFHENFSKCTNIDIGIVAGGSESSRRLVTLVKSILFYRHSPITFYFLTDDKSYIILKHLFSTWNLPFVYFSFILINDTIVNQVNWIPNKHYSGLFGLLKLLLPELLPKNLTQIIILDTDIVVVQDIDRLWKHFEQFQKQQCLGFVENQSNWYVPGKYWKSHRPWPALGRGVNTGVILMNLSKLRRLGWNSLWRYKAENDLSIFYSTALADQDIFNSFLKSYPEYLYSLPCFWNIQFSDHSHFSKFCLSQSPLELGIIHFNSPKKLDVKTLDNISYFKNLFLTFIQLDGNLLRETYIKCNNSIQTNNNNIVYSSLDPCLEFQRHSNIKYRTHLYFLNYNPNHNASLTLVSQCSGDRIAILELLSKHWNGPMSISFYLSDVETHELILFVSSSDVLKKRSNIAYHVVYKEGSYYPINYLRNVALHHADTEFVFLTDIDFLPSTNAFDSVSEMIRKNWISKAMAFVVPAFEMTQYRMDDFPSSKAEVIKALDEGTLYTFRYHTWKQGHAQTNFRKWRAATKPYKVNWKEDFEPYIVLRKNEVVDYDTRFVGFGWNKVSHVMELAAKNFSFVVLPNVYLIHSPHASSHQLLKFRNSLVIQRCLTNLKNEFINQINAKYGKKFYLK